MFSFYRNQDQKPQHSAAPDPAKLARLEQAREAVNKAQRDYDHAYAVYFECRDPKQQAEAKQHYLKLGQKLSEVQSNLRSLQNT